MSPKIPDCLKNSISLKLCNSKKLRGLFKNFKIPVWYDFDKKMTDKELKEIITKLEDITYHVICLTMDNGGDNIGLAGSLGISEEDQPYFDHPTRPGEKVFVFFDPVHLLKLMRNHILEKGFILESGITVGLKQFEKLLKEQGTCETTDTKLTKLTGKHIYPKDQEKQTVLTAVQLFSSSVAHALEMLSSEDPAMKALSEFCLLCDSWFDTSNSNREVHLTKPFKSAFGENLQMQKDCMEQMANAIGKLTVKKHENKSMMQWQKGILIYCKGLPMMFEDLTRLYGIRSLFTMRTNQDAVENLFSQLRFLAGNCRTFGRLQFEFVLRNFILGSGHQIPIEHAASVQLSPDPEVQLVTRKSMKSNQQLF